MSPVRTEYEFDINESNLRDSVLKIVLDLRPNWRECPLEEIQIKDLNGGVTNRLLSCYLAKNGLDTPDTVLLRIYGNNTEQFICRDEEVRTMILMNKVNLGPQFYTKFKNGIVYEFLPGNIVDFNLVNDENVYTKIANSMASLHLVNFDGFKTESDLEPGQKPFIFEKIREILNLINPDYKSNMQDMTDELLDSIPSVEQLNKELDSLESYFKNYCKNSLIVFSHNDLLLGNIIYNEKTSSIKFIDYEYGAINYQAYDIANHFNEFSGVEEPDYSLFPSKEYQLKWLRIYLESFYSKINRFYVKQTDEPVVIDDEKVNRFYEEVNKFTVTSHFMWAIWSLVQAQNSTLDFNFVKYSQIRFNEFNKQKAKHLADL